MKKKVFFSFFWPSTDLGQKPLQKGSKWPFWPSTSLVLTFEKNLDVVIDKTTQKKGSLFYEKKKFFFHFFDLALI